MLLTGFALAAVLGALGICAGVGAFGSFAWLWILPVGWLGLMLGLLAAAFLFLWLVTAPVKVSAPQERDSKFYRYLMYAYESAIFPLLHTKIHTTGLELLPKQGRYVVMCNHLYLFDALVLHKSLPNSDLAFVAKKEVNQMFIVGKLLHKTMGQTIDRENDRAAVTTIRNCIDLLGKDEVNLAVFPEGYCSKDGQLQPFRNGVFKIPQRAKVPIVVCTVRNTQRMMGNLLHPRAKHVYFDVLAVIPPEEFLHGTTNLIGDRVHKIMEEHLNAN